MARRDEIVEFCDQTLQPGSFPDGCPNGLQVYGRAQVVRLATCPSVSLEFFERARHCGADCLLVHHGLFWDRDSRVIHAHLGDRLRALLVDQINLLAYHLPLDAHRELGNNACLAARLELTGLDWNFGLVRGTPIGVAGSLPAPLSIAELAERLAQALGARPQVFDCGARPIRRVAVLAGGGGDSDVLLECQRLGCDALVTGNLYEQAVAVARELRIDVIAAGHYNSEKLGVVALGDRIADRFGIEVLHLEVPNPV